MVAICAAPLEIAVARCSEPFGAINGSSAANAGLSNAPAIPSTKGRDENLRHREKARIGAPGEKQRRQPFRDLAELHHALAFVAVGGVAGHEQQQGGREELHQPDHAEIERAAGHVVDLPADGDGPDLAGEARQASRQQKRQERWMPEQIAGADRHQGRHGKAGILLFEA